jgi:hypothetical protein
MSLYIFSYFSDMTNTVLQGKAAKMLMKLPILEKELAP